MANNDSVNQSQAGIKLTSENIPKIIQMLLIEKEKLISKEKLTKEEKSDVLSIESTIKALEKIKYQLNRKKF